jgi:hypothetical protein
MFSCVFKVKTGQNHTLNKLKILSKVGNIQVLERDTNK